MWPESWTCCRGSWESKGCTRGRHRGVPEKKLLRLCLKVGEINPKTNRPDSACGKLFPEEDNDGCIIHQGYFIRLKYGSDEGKWSCCEGLGLRAEPCSKSTHEFKVWPDPEAKRYFVEK